MDLLRIADTIAEEQIAKMVHDDGTDVGDVEVIEPVGEGVHKDRSDAKMASTFSKRFVLVLTEDMFRHRRSWLEILEDVGIPYGEEADWNEPNWLELNVSGGKAS